MEKLYEHYCCGKSKNTQENLFLLDITNKINKKPNCKNKINTIREEINSINKIPEEINPKKNQQKISNRILKKYEIKIKILKKKNKQYICKLRKYKLKNHSSYKLSIILNLFLIMYFIKINMY